MTGFKKVTRTLHFSINLCKLDVIGVTLHLTSSQVVSREAIQFYSALFSDDLPPMEIEENTILSCIPSVVTREMNDSLMRPVSMPNLEGVVSNLPKGKAPGLDGFPAEFFQEFWDIISHDLLDVVHES